MLKKIIDNSSLNWISSDKLPERKTREDNISKEVIMIFYDGFITRGYYNYTTDAWCGYDSNMHADMFYTSPDYYVLL